MRGEWRPLGKKCPIAGCTGRIHWRPSARGRVQVKCNTCTFSENRPRGKGP